MHLSGIAIGAATVLAIGALPPLVIKAGYRMGVGSRWLFLIQGPGHKRRS